MRALPGILIAASKRHLLVIVCASATCAQRNLSYQHENEVAYSCMTEASLPNAALSKVQHRCHTAASNRQVIRMDGILFHSMLSVHLVVNLIVFRNYMHLQSCSMYALHSGTASHLD